MKGGGGRCAARGHIHALGHIPWGGDESSNTKSWMVLECFDVVPVTTTTIKSPLPPKILHYIGETK